MHKFAENWIDLDFAVVDVETTGLKSEEGDRIIEIGIVRFENGEVVDKYNQLIDPECEISEDSTRITGISESDIEGMPKFREVAEEIAKRLSNVAIVAYNLEFDKGFISHELKLSGQKWPEESLEIDPLIITRKLTPGRGNKGLGKMCKKFGIPLENAHRASEDAEATGHLLYKLASEFGNQLPQKTTEFLNLLNTWGTEFEVERAKRHGGKAAKFTQNIAVGLGNPFIYGTEPDPLRALYSTVPMAPER